MRKPRILVPISLAPGDRITHITLGRGVVVNPPADNSVEIRFDRTAEIRALLADGQYLSHIDASDDREAADPFAAERDEWRHSVFEFETDTVDHDNVTLWSPVFSGPAEVMENFQRLLSAANYTKGMSEFYPPPREETATWQKALLSGPGSMDSGASFTVTLEGDAKRIAQNSPCMPSLTQLNIQIEKVRVWPNGVNASIECRMDDSSLTFFDNHFAANRGWYYPDAKFSFLIGALAISCRVGIEQIPVSFTEADRERWNTIEASIREQGYPSVEAPNELSLANMAVYLHEEPPDQDYAEYRGRLHEAREIEFMGLKAWKVSIVFLRSISNKDVPMTMVITSRAWTHDFPPVVGMDVEGLLWMQGRMCFRRWT